MKHSRFSYFSSLLFVLALIVGLLGMAQPAQASAPRGVDLWVTDGRVNTTLLSGNTLYIGGGFSYVGPPTGSFGVLDASGTLDPAFPPVKGVIHAITPDGSGGWYLGGSFTQVGGHPWNNLVHLKSDYSLDFAWNPNPNNEVRTLALSGQTLYVGGRFITINGQTRGYIAALDASTGNLTAWNPGASGPVFSLVVSGSTVYVGGGFSIIGGQTRYAIAALDASTAKATDWNPGANSSVLSLVVSGSTVYAGGDFGVIGGQTRYAIAALDASTGKATDWAPDAIGTVRSLAVNGGTVYASGNFSIIGGQPRNHVAALDASTGLATDWDPKAVSYEVNALALSGSTVYVGGRFTEMGGQPRKNIAALDASTGLATTWSPNASGPVQALVVAPPVSGESGSRIAAGGDFDSIGGQIRNKIAALDITTGRATAWNPNATDNADSWVYALAVNGSTVYAGGNFTTIGGQARNNIAALDASTGLATTWNPNAWLPNRMATVYALAVSGSTVYAGGEFTTIGGQTRYNIAGLDAGSGLATDWSPNAYGIVHALGVNGGTIYAGGKFTGIGGQTRYNIAALDASSGLATDWKPSLNSNVYALLVNGGTVYVGGSFSLVNGNDTRSRIAALDATTGLATDWNPSADSTVSALAIRGSTIYAGGYFTSIGGQSRNYLAALDINTGLATTWNPNINNAVIALAVALIPGGGDSSMVYAAGNSFSSFERYDRLFALRDGALTCQTAASGGSWRASNWSNCGGAIPGDGDSVSVQAGHTLTLYNNLAVNDLTIAADGELALPPGSNLSVEGTLTHNGRLTQTLTVPASMTTPFLNLKNTGGTVNKFFGVTLAPAGDMGNTRVTIAGNQNCSSVPGDELVKRCFEISPTTPRAATARFYYSFAELNGLLSDRLNLWQRNPTWTLGGFTSRRSATCAAGQQDCWVEAFHVSNYAPFVLSNRAYPVTFLPVLRR